MTIGYDNEAAACIRNPDLEAGHWYLSQAGVLYIVPRDGEIEGPDDSVSDALETAYRRDGFDAIDSEALAQAMGLTVAFAWQRRFDPVKGYFAG